MLFEILGFGVGHPLPAWVRTCVHKLVMYLPEALEYNVVRDVFVFQEN